MWSDTRNANREFQPEDVYAASVRFDDGAGSSAGPERSVPGWLVLAAGAAVGLGVSTVLGLVAIRRARSTTPASAPVRRTA